MEWDNLLKRIAKEGRSFSANEREKVLGEYDPIYLQEKIKHHGRKALLAHLVLFLLVVTLGVGLYVVFDYEALRAQRVESLGWYKGLFVVLAVLCVLGLGVVRRNHAKSASLLRLVDYVQRARALQQEQKPITQSTPTPETLAPTEAERDTAK